MLPTSGPAKPALPKPNAALTPKPLPKPVEQAAPVAPAAPAGDVAILRPRPAVAPKPQAAPAAKPEGFFSRHKLVIAGTAIAAAAVAGYFAFPVAAYAAGVGAGWLGWATFLGGAGLAGGAVGAGAGSLAMWAKDAISGK